MLNLQNELDRPFFMHLSRKKPRLGLDESAAAAINTFSTCPVPLRIFSAANYGRSASNVYLRSGREHEASNLLPIYLHMAE
jgi:hypothetical protein